mmetsp:Transcript_25116/g.41845  ORF Transcript_25116/g.41845 Transcript_25116/m.41845 type:complete len:311 (+) Transcript_25116:37-969(+)
MDTALGIDLGGTHVTCIIIDVAGQVLDKSITPITDRSVASVLPLLCTVSKEILSRNSNLVCKGIGIGIPGNVDPTLNSTRYLPNFGWSEPVPVGLRLQQELELPVYMRNDGRCAALAESKFGVGKESQVFAMLTLGTGIGGALIHEGKLFDGSTFDAGDFGHHVIASGIGFDCVCGKRGCFECHASAMGLVRHYWVRSSSSGMLELLPPDLTAEKVIQEIQRGSLPALDALEDYKEDLSTGLANLVTFYNPDTIALGGGLSQAWSQVFGDLEARVDAKLLPASRGHVRILPAALSVDAGAIGAALLAFGS